MNQNSLEIDQQPSLAETNLNQNPHPYWGAFWSFCEQR